MADIESNIRIDVDTSGALAAIRGLQSQISQFQTAMNRGTAAQAAAASKLSQQLVSGINATGKFAASIRTVQTSSEAFTSALERNKLSMGEYFRFAGASTKRFSGLFKSEFNTIEKTARERVKTIQTQYIKLGRDASGAMKSIAVRPLALNMDDLGTKTAIAAQKQQIMNQLLKQGSTNLLNFGKNTQWAGRQLMVGFTIPLTIFGGLAAKTFMDLEEQVINFKKVYGDLFTTDQEAEQALNEVKALADEFTKYGVAVSETVGLAADAAAAGFGGADLINQTSAAIKVSVLGQLDQQKALDTTIALQNAFKLSSEDLADAINFLNAVENQTVVALDDITTAIPKVAPVIQALGGDVRDLAFFLSAMKEGGVNASEGANALKSSLGRLINPTKVAREMFRGFGIDLVDIVERNAGNLRQTVLDLGIALDTLDPLNRSRAIEQLFGKFQFARMSTLFENINADGTQAARVLDLASYSAADLARISEEELGVSAASAMNQFRGAVERLQKALAPLGELFLQIATPLVEFATNVLDRFNNLDEGVKRFVAGLTAVLGVVGPVALMTFGLLANGVANLIKGFLAVRNVFQNTGKQTQVLGEQTQYLTQQQLEEMAVAASLETTQNKLTQTFTSQTAAVNKLTAAYEKAIAKQRQFGGAGIATSIGGSNVRKYKRGTVSVPGSGTGDKVPAMLEPGEAVIPRKQAKKYSEVIKAMVAGNIPGFRFGFNPMQFMLGRSRVATRMGSQTFISSLRSGDLSYKSGFATGTGADFTDRLGRPMKQHQLMRRQAENKLYGVPVGKNDPSMRPTYGSVATSPLQRILNLLLGRRGRQFNRVTNPMASNLDQYGDISLIGKRSMNRRASTFVGDTLLKYSKNPAWVKGTAPMRGASQSQRSAAGFGAFDTPFGTTRDARGGVSQNPAPSYIEAQTMGGFRYNEVQKIIAKDPAIKKQLQQELRAAGLGNIRVSSPNFLSKLMQRLNVPGFQNGLVPGFGKGDKFPALLEPGEAVIPADATRKYAPFIEGMITGNLPGFQGGGIFKGRRPPATIQEGTQYRDVFAHIGDSLEMSVDDFAQSLIKAGKKVPSIVQKFIDQGLGQSKLRAYGGLGFETRQSFNDAMKPGREGVMPADFLQDFDQRGISKWNTSLKVAGLKMEDVSEDLTFLDKEISEQIRSAAELDQQFVVTDEVIEEFTNNALSKLRQKGSKLAQGFDAANNKVTEFRIMPKRSELTAAGFSRDPEDKDYFISPDGSLRTKAGREKRTSRGPGGLSKAVKSDFDAVVKNSKAADKNMQAANENVKNAKKEKQTTATKESAVKIFKEAAIKQDAAAQEVFKIPGARRASTSQSVLLAARKQEMMGLDATAGGFVTSSARPGRAFDVQTRQPAQAGGQGIASRLSGLSGGIMQASFAFSSISMLAGGLGGEMNGLQEAIFGISNAMFALTAILPIVTTLFTKLAGQLANQSFAQMLSGGFGKLGGILTRLAPMFLKFVPFLGAAITAFGAIKVIGDIQEEQKQKIEGMGNAAFAAGEKLKNIASIIGFDPTRDVDRSDQISQISGLSAGGTARAQGIRESEEFQRLAETSVDEGGFKEDIENIKNASLKDAEAALNSLVIQLMALAPEGTDPQKVQEFVAAIAAEAEKTQVDLSLGVQFDPFKPETFDKIAKQSQDIANNVRQNFENELAQLEDFTFVSGAGLETASLSQIEGNVSDELRAGAETLGAQYSALFEQLQTGLQAGTISATEYRTQTSALLSDIKSLGPAVARLTLDEAFENIGLPDVANDIKNVESQALILQASLAGVDITESQLEAIAAGEELDATGSDIQYTYHVLQSIMSDYEAKTGETAKSVEELEEEERKRNINLSTEAIDDQITSNENMLELYPDLVEALGNEEEALKAVNDEKTRQLINDAIAQDLIEGGNANYERVIGLLNDQADSQEKVNNMTAESNLDTYIADLEEQNSVLSWLTNNGVSVADAMKVIGDGTLYAGAVAAMSKEEFEDFEEELEKFFALSDKLSQGTGTREQSPFEKAIEGLRKERKQLRETTTAYNKLRREGFSITQAFEAAKDPVLATAIATTKVGTDRWKELVNLLGQVDTLASRNAIKDLLSQRAAANDLNEAFVGVAKVLGDMGYELDDIRQIMNDPNLMQRFIDDLEDGKLDSKLLRDYLNQIDDEKRIQVEIDLSTEEGIENEFMRLYDEAMEGFAVRRERVEDDFEDSIKNAEDAVEATNDQIEQVQRSIESIETTISDKQREIELNIARPIQEFQEQIAKLERSIELQFTRPIADLQEESSDLANDLTLMDKEIEGINERYDDQLEALNKIKTINDVIARQQQGQLDIANALSQGDIAEAARAAQQLREEQAAARDEEVRNRLELARQREIEALKTRAGLTRKQIEQRQFEIGQAIFQLEEQREEVQAKIQTIQDSIYTLEQQRKVELLEIRDLEDRIYQIQQDQLKPLEQKLRDQEDYLENITAERDARIEAIDLEAEAWDDVKLQFDESMQRGKDYIEMLIKAEKLLARLRRYGRPGGGDDNGRFDDDDATDIGNDRDMAETSVYRAEGVEVLDRETAAAAAVSAVKSGQAATPLDFANQVKETVLANRKAVRSGTVSGSQKQKLMQENIDLMQGTGLKFALGGMVQKLMGGGMASKLYGMGGKVKRYGGGGLTEYLAGGGIPNQSAGSGQVGYYPMGGLIPYKANGGLFQSVNTDTVPAMLTPGEFVVRRYAVDKYGVDKLKSINNGTYNGESVYNYNLNVNVKSDANPDEIARSVMTQIKQVDAQRVRGNRF